MSWPRIDAQSAAAEGCADRASQHDDSNLTDAGEPMTAHPGISAGSSSRRRRPKTGPMTPAAVVVVLAGGMVAALYARQDKMLFSPRAFARGWAHRAKSTWN